MIIKRFEIKSICSVHRHTYMYNMLLYYVCGSVFKNLQPDADGYFNYLFNIII